MNVKEDQGATPVRSRKASGRTKHTKIHSQNKSEQQIEMQNDTIENISSIPMRTRSERHTKKRTRVMADEIKVHQGASEDVQVCKKAKNDLPLQSFQRDLIRQFNAVIMATISLLKRSQDVSFDKIRAQASSILKEDFVLSDMRILHAVLPQAFMFYWHDDALYVRFNVISNTDAGKSSKNDSYTHLFYNLIAQFTEYVKKLKEPVPPTDISTLPKSPKRALPKPEPYTPATITTPNKSQEQALIGTNAITEQILQNQAKRNWNKKGSKLSKYESDNASTELTHILSKETQQQLLLNEQQFKLDETIHENLDRRYLLSSSLETANIIENLLLVVNKGKKAGMLLADLQKKIVATHRKNKSLREVKQHIQCLIETCPEWCSLEHLQSNPTKAVFIINRETSFSKVREKITTLMSELK